MSAAQRCSPDRSLESNASRPTFDARGVDASALCVPREFKLRFANPSGTSIVDVAEAIRRNVIRAVERQRFHQRQQILGGHVQ